MSSAAVLQRYNGRVLLIIAPPRTASTAISRVFWSSFSFYSHEPCERAFYLHEPPPSSVAQAILERAVSLPARTARPATNGGDQEDLPHTRCGLVVKCMSYAVLATDMLAWLLKLTAFPVIMVVRDPRRAAASRMRGYAVASSANSATTAPISGGGSVTPVAAATAVEGRAQIIECVPGVVPESADNFSGFTQLQALIEQCQTAGHPFIIVDSGSLRQRPDELIPRLFKRLGLPYTEDAQANWLPATDLPIDNMSDSATPMMHLYRRALNSTRLEPEDEKPAPPLSAFSEEGGLRRVVAQAMAVYQKLMQRDEVLC